MALLTDECSVIQAKGPMCRMKRIQVVKLTRLVSKIGVPSPCVAGWPWTVQGSLLPQLADTRQRLGAIQHGVHAPIHALRRLPPRTSMETIRGALTEL